MTDGSSVSGGVFSSVCELSGSQRNIINLCLSQPGLPIGNVCATLEIDGRLDAALLQRALRSLFVRSGALRTRLVREGGDIRQAILARVPEQFPFFDFAMTGQDGVRRWAASVAREPMALFDAPLCYCAIYRVSENTGGVLIKTHHVISDAWSQMLLANRLIETYLGLLRGETPDETPDPHYAQHVCDEQAYLAGDERARDRDYFAQKLAGAPPTLAKERAYAALSPIGHRLSFALPERLNRLIAAFCERNKVSPFAVFYMALSVYLHRVRGQKRTCIGVPVINRRTFAEKQTVGMFVNTLPFVFESGEGAGFDALNRALQDEWFELLRHQRLPYEDIRAQRGGQDALFDIVLSFQNGQMYHSEDLRIQFEGRWQYSGYQAEALCIHLSSRGGEGRFLVDYDYLTQVFSAAEISDMHRYLVNLLCDGLTHPGKEAAALTLLCAEDEERVLFQFNRAPRCAPMADTLGAQLALAAKSAPTRVALIAGGQRLTYQALMERARATALRLAALYPGGGRVIGLLLPRSFELMTALCATALSGNAFLLLDPALPPARRDALLRACGASLCLAQDNIQTEVQTLSPDALARLGAAEALPDVSPDALAYMVFTSGSTGEPKAVRVAQRSILNFAAGMRALYPKGAVLSVTTVSFDAFLIESLCPLLCARTIVLADEDERFDPERLAALIRGYDAGFLTMTPSRLQAYLHCAPFAAALENIQCIVCGGEAFPGELYSALGAHTQARIYNQYGPSEATVGVTLKRVTGASIPTIGSPMPGCRVYILDGRMQPLPVGAQGEIYLGGACLAEGYHGDAALTQSRFVPDPFCPGETLYRTGDLGLWTDGGEIVFCGRADQQLKLRGYRIEPAEIEARLLSHPLVESAAVRLWHAAANPMLVAWYTARGALAPEELLAYAAAYLPRYMLPVRAVRLERLPMTANGKVDTARLPAPAAKAAAAPPADALERTLLSLFSRSLKGAPLTAEDDYFLAGGDSLSAVTLLGEIAQALGSAPTLTELYANATARRLAALLRGAPAAGQAFSIPRAPEQADYPLSPAQQGFFVMQSADASGTAYNIPGAFAPDRPLDEGRLARAFDALIAQEELLRAGFAVRGGGVRMTVHERAPFTLERVEAPTLAAAFAAFVRPFDLARPPLLRAALWTGPEGQRLLIDMHHIISDGISGRLYLERLGALYEGRAAERPALRYRDYACWMAGEGQAALSRQRAYWQNALAGELPTLDLPTDHARPAVFDGRGGKVRFALDEKTAAAVRARCERERLTPFMLLLAAWSLLLGRLAGQEELLVGSPVSGRRERALERVAGPFVNTVPLRVRPARAQTVRDYLASVRETVLGALEHQNVPFEQLVALSGVARDTARNALYSVMFSLLPEQTSEFSLGDTRLRALPAHAQTAKLDLNLEVAPEGAGYACALEYAATLFDGETAALYARCFAAVAAALARAQDDQALVDVPLLAPADRLALVERPWRMRTPYDATFIDEMIDRQALLAPDAVAIAWGEGETYTYAQVAARAGALAARLIARGVRVGDRVAILCKRNGDLPVALLAILKAGAAFVPLDAAFPPERMLYMLENTQSRLLLLGDGLSAPEGAPCPAVPLDFTPGEPFTPPEGRSIDDVFFVLYTSGSTGKPKGVMVVHKSLSTLLVDAAQVIDFEGARVLCAANVIFDVFTTETLLTMALGRRVVMADEEEMTLPWRMAARIVRSGANVVQLTPSRMQMCVGDEAFLASLKGARALILCGEPWNMQLLNTLRAATHARIINIYGPTEVTIYSSWADLTDAGAIHIGKPVANCRYYLLDQARRLVPPTARGELYIAGECLARGYMNRPDLTEQAFLPDPFFPGERMYKTGDVVRQRADGNWECLGRLDNQLKMNGHRIEPDEIIGQIMASGLAAEAALVPVRKGGVPVALRAFVVPAAGYSERALLDFITPRLPDYMVPSAVIALDALPRTASGKTDNLALARMESAPQKPAGRALSDTERMLADIWREVLAQQAVDADVSFFSQGGTSLTALVALSHYYQRDISMSLGDFYRLPTIAAQAAAIRAGALTRGEAEDITQAPGAQGGVEKQTTNELQSVSPFDEENRPRSELLSSIPPAARENSAPERPQTAGTAAPVPVASPEPVALAASPASVTSPAPVTAQTPPSGESARPAHPMEAAAPPPPTESALSDPAQGALVALPRRFPQPLPVPRNTRGVLVTGASGFLGAHLAHALLQEGAPVYCLVRDEGRLREALRAYFPQEDAALARTLSLVTGDVTAPLLGLSREAYDGLAGRVGAVWHCAADVRHYAPAGELLRANVGGARGAIAFARAAGATLYHISTASVCGTRIPAAPGVPALFGEEDLYIGQDHEENPYVHSKLLAEAAVAQAMRAGLCARVMRVGRLTARNADGVFQRNPETNAFYRLVSGLMALGALPERLRDFPVEATPVDLCVQAMLLLAREEGAAFHVLNPRTIPLERMLAGLSRAMPDAAFDALLRSRLGENPYIDAFAEAYLSGAWARPQVRLSMQDTLLALAAQGFQWPPADLSALMRCFPR